MISNTIYDDLFTITGQKPFFTRAKKSIATFKLRKGNILGVKTTLRKNTMYEFIDKLINIALPRVRDFKGINCLYFDGKGNISIGVKEYLVFPEIDFDKIIKVRGLNISIVTSAKTDVEAKFLLETLNIPFEKKKKMTRKGLIQKNLKRIYTVNKFCSIRSDLKRKIKDKSISLKERFIIHRKLSEMPRDSSKVRIRNRCSITGRSRGIYRKFMLSRICIRLMAGNNELPGVRKSSW